MPHIEVNLAQIFYESYGDNSSDGIPIVLIHGATGTGASNWSLVAPLLARNRRVIVPDCRGHGRSTNPSGVYTFKQMAADTAGLVRALGYEKAHIIGHSNGGNTALVTLLEHPDIIQTAVVQAANAYISPDLVENEPPIFDPVRVARDAPAWRDQMIALHGETHGAEYWRTLLRITVEELIHEPNYTPADLAVVQRPTLVIEGADDRVNAPSQHGRFISEHIPFAEFWAPVGIGHNVHDELLFQWVELVEDFIRRRGDSANEALYRLRRSQYKDEREQVFELHAEQYSIEGQPQIRLEGRVLTSEQLEAATQAMPAGIVKSSGVKVLLTDQTPCAMVNRGVDDLRREPRLLAERVSQALMGEAVQVLESRDTWSYVRMEKDGYRGWIHTASLHSCSASEAHTHRSACDQLVYAGFAHALLEPGGHAHLPTPEAGILPFGVRVLEVERHQEWVGVRLPDDRVWWLAASDLLPLDQRPSPDLDGIQRALRAIQRFVGVPYMWGGRSPFGYDCSGLAQSFYGFLGIDIPRDADQQMQAAVPVQGEPQPGDLLFFGEAGGTGHRPISHVAISMGGAEMVHANGPAWGVSYNSFDPASPRYSQWLHANLAGVGRFR